MSQTGRRTAVRETSVFEHYGYLIKAAPETPRNIRIDDIAINSGTFLDNGTRGSKSNPSHKKMNIKFWTFHLFCNLVETCDRRHHKVTVAFCWLLLQLQCFYFRFNSASIPGVTVVHQYLATMVALRETISSKHFWTAVGMKFVVVICPGRRSLVVVKVIQFAWKMGNVLNWK